METLISLAPHSTEPLHTVDLVCPMCQVQYVGRVGAPYGYCGYCVYPMGQKAQRLELYKGDKYE